MFKKGSKLYSILTGSCPKCHQESMYSDTNPYHLTKTLTMHDNCSHCGIKYKIEPSFFYGAMYVSYGVGIAFAVAAAVISGVFLKASIHYVFASIAGTLIIFAPIIMRISRNIWINMFVHFDKNAVKKK
ncbi:MAG: DUF983 domain-containing protein [Oceanihabitans sp.]|jgi:uncharacterized protein (DUF983 family)|nr:DUF983 domain-containing protein [Oceanihabitans sp.]